MLPILLVLQAFAHPQNVPPNQNAPSNAAWNAEFLSTAVPLITDASGDITRCISNNDWGLSYDDGPGPFTPILLDALQKHNLKATFFVQGSQVIQYKDTLRRAYAAGHQIGLHTWSHPPLNTMSNEVIVAEVMNTALLIKEVIGVMPKFIRPPYGAIDSRVRGVLHRLGLTPVLWSHDTHDNSNPNNIANLIKSWIVQKEGQIVLAHDKLEVTARQAAEALDLIVAAGFNSKPVGTCVGRSDWYGDIVGVRPPPPPPSNTISNPVSSGSGSSPSSLNPSRPNHSQPSSIPAATHAPQNGLSANATDIQGPISSEGDSEVLGLIVNSTLPAEHLNATVYDTPESESSSANGLVLDVILMLGALMFVL